MLELRLLVRGTDDYILVDKQDWNIVKDIYWVFKNGRVEAKNGLSYEQIIGLEFYKNRVGNVLDKRREFYIPQNQNWVYSEYHQQYIAI